jgi:hypothetical protein
MRMPTAMKTQVGGGRGMIPTTAMKRGIPGTAGGSQSSGRPITAVSGAGFFTNTKKIVNESSNIHVTLEPKVET